MMPSDEELDYWIGSNSSKKAIARAAYLAGQASAEPVACPYPCGWKNLFSIIVESGAFLARSLSEDEPITEHQRNEVMRMIGFARELTLHGMQAHPTTERRVPKEQVAVINESHYSFTTPLSPDTRRVMKMALEAIEVLSSAEWEAVAALRKALNAAPKGEV